ncbi:hypothetical protein NP493_1625g00017 [Ridgeia piscesae]|uniref:Uncharacterized protein n=1 Tax=Ridgeia piscesae TaxID=27915 RepID=A0AAD9N8A7_RIDPI|nr:hypothetical protein NP493_1625g00017 [Ridgeia piscesae]
MIISLTGRGISVSFVKAHSGLPSFSFGFANPEERVFQVVETTRLGEPCFT